MKFTKKLVTVAAALCAAGALFLASCSVEEDPYGILKVSGDNCTIDFTNDKDVNYARAFKTTKTKHLSADILVDLDISSPVEVKANGSADNAYTVGYIFNLNGSGTEKDPYSFALIGLRYEATGGLKYFVSYYTDVLSEAVSSNSGNFDGAVEYELEKAWVKNLPAGTKCTVNSDANTVKVFIDVDVFAGDVLVTEDNYGDYKDAMDTYKIRFAPDETEVEAEKKTYDVVITKEKLNGVKSASAPTLDDSTFKVAQAKLGYYAMVKLDTTLKCNMTMTDTVKSASTGDAIIWDEEITNVR